MRKILLAIVCLLSFSAAVHAQIVSADWLKQRKVKMFGYQNWKNVARDIAQNVRLDERNAINYVKVMNIPGCDENELFNKASRWAEVYFNTSECAVRQIDANSKTVVVQGYVGNVADHMGFSYNYDISLKPVVKMQFKDEKARVTFTISSYNVYKSGTNTSSSEVWSLVRCYPFLPFGDEHEVTSAKALVMSHVCAAEYMRSIEYMLRQPAMQSGAEDW